MLINQNGVETLYYGYTDNQGSLVALTDASGNVVEKYAYDPWGARRNPNDWTQKDSRTSWLSNRGYTGHEHLDLFNIINMNGRVYDPLTAQFYSPDPFIQSGSDWKNYNRYSYCMNNPTRYTDPSGYKFTGEATSNDSQRELWSNYAGSYGGGGSSSFRAWAASHRGSVSYNWENYRYEYANGDEASSNSALDQLYSRTSPQDIQNYSGSSLGYDHLYTLNIGGQLRLAGSLGGEITGTKNGNFVTTNNGFAAVLAANSEAVAWGGNGSSKEGENLTAFGNWANGIGVGLGAISLSVGRAIQNEAAYVNSSSFIKPIQTMLKVGPANLLVNNAAITKGLTRTGFVLAGVSAGLTIYDGARNGWQDHHSADLVVNGALTGLSIVCPAAGLVVGGLYFVGDVASQYYTGKSITQNLFDE
jgi:RHS repeat-associated protein